MTGVKKDSGETGNGRGGEVTVHTRGHDRGSEGDGHLQGRVTAQEGGGEVAQRMGKGRVLKQGTAGGGASRRGTAGGTARVRNGKFTQLQAHNSREP